VRIEAAGKQWCGQWQVDGGDLVLSSAYGCRRATIGRQDRDELAMRLMRQILDNYSKKGIPSLRTQRTRA
jgi:hypothetical protein